MKAFTNISGSNSTYTQIWPAQQTSIGNIPANNPNFSRIFLVTSDAVMCQRGPYGVAITLADLLELFVTSEPNLTFVPFITTQPESISVVSTNPANFGVVAVSEFTSVTYQWQVSTDSGANWSNLSNGGAYANVTTATMTVTPPNTGYDQYQYRCIVTNGTGSTTSTAATLSVPT